MSARLLFSTTILTFLLVASLVNSTVVQAQSTTPPANELDPESPMAALPDLGIDWPDMTANAVVPGSPDEAAEVVVQSTQIVGERRYRVSIEGLDPTGRSTIVERFNVASTLKAGEGKPANVAQIDRRAREDANLLDEILRADGYYDADIETAIEGGEAGQLVIKLIVTPGQLYRFSSVEVTGLDSTGEKQGTLRDAFAINAEDAVDADNITLGQSELFRKIRKEGYPFAKLGEPEVTVDHDTRKATLKMAIDPGGKRYFGEIILSGPKLPFDAKHVARMARFKPGEIYDQTKAADDLRRALVASGLVAQASVRIAEDTVEVCVDAEVTYVGSVWRHAIIVGI